MNSRIIAMVGVGWMLGGMIAVGGIVATSGRGVEMAVVERTGRRTGGRIGC
jgi:hypothetical protein